MNLMLINVSTHKFGMRSDCRRATSRRRPGAGYRSRRPRALRALGRPHAEWMASTCPSSTCWLCRSTASTDRRLVLVAAIGIDGNGVKHPLGLIEGATENAAVVQA
jgi:hypothetical protein